MRTMTIAAGVKSHFRFGLSVLCLLVLVPASPSWGDESIIDGPYVDCPDNPLISYKDMERDIEDPYAYEISWGTITQRKEEDSTSLYLNVVDWPKDATFTLFGVDNKVLNASLLATGEAIEHETAVDTSSGHSIITLEVPRTAPDEYVSVIKLVVSGAVSMDQTFLQLGDGKVVMGTYNAYIHDLEDVPNKPDKVIDMKMYTVPLKGEGIMPARGLTVSGFQTKGQALSWDFRVFKPGTYEVVVVCHCGRNRAWHVPGRVRANVAGQSVENELIESKRVTTPTMDSGVVDLHSVLGTVAISSPGAYTLTLEIASDFTRAKPRFRAVMLTPVTHARQ